MYSVLKSYGLNGLNGFAVAVEADVSGGLPAFSLVGLPDSAVRESGDRVHAAARNLGFKWPDRRITVNLAPADVRKTGPVYDLPLLLDTEGSVGVLVRVYYADTRHHLNTRFDLPLDTVAVPADWQQRVLGEWVVYRTEVDEDVSYPEESGEQYTLKLEAGDSPDTVRATLTRISKYGDTTTETRTGVLTRGSVGFGFEGECWQLRCLRPEDENYEWAIALRDDGTMTMANMGGNAEYSYISWMDLRRS